jgi:hypothetical protein
VRFGLEKETLKSKNHPPPIIIALFRTRSFVFFKERGKKGLRFGVEKEIRKRENHSPPNIIAQFRTLPSSFFKERGKKGVRFGLKNSELLLRIGTYRKFTLAFWFLKKTDIVPF